MEELHSQGVKTEAIKSCMEGIPIDPKIKASIQSLSEAGASVRVLSDANTLFIQWILEAQGLGKCIDLVVRLELSAGQK